MVTLMFVFVVQLEGTWMDQRLDEHFALVMSCGPQAKGQRPCVDAAGILQMGD